MSLNLFSIGEHTNLLGEQYIREHFDQSENKKFFGDQNCSLYQVLIQYALVTTELRR